MSVPTPAESHDTVDPDLIDQAKPGHGIPSQDPDPSAQFAISRRESRREKRTVYMGAGVLVGAAAGAAVGASLAGPVGVVVGGTIGAVIGGAGSAAFGSL